MYIEHKVAQKVFITLFVLLTAWIISDPYTTLTPMQGLVLIFFVFFIHANIEKRFIIKQYAVKTDKQNKLLESIYKYCPDAISHKNYKYQYVFGNDVFCNILGIKDKNSIINKTCYDIFDRDSADIVRKNDEKVMNEGNPVTYEVKFMVNGKETIYQSVAVPIVKDNDIVGVLTIGRDVTKNEELTRSLNQKHTQLKTLLNTLPMVAYLKNINSEYIIGNSLSKSSYVKNSRIMYQDKIKEEDKRIIQTKQTICYERQVCLEDGTNAWHRIYKAPILDSEGNVNSIAVLMKNIEIEKNLQSQRDTYVATLSHDLKTPTIAQIRALELLLSKELGEVNKDQEELLNLTLDSCKYMFEMVSTLLNTYKYENGEINLHHDYFDMNQLVETCLNEVSQLTREKEHLIIFKPAASTNIVNADKVQIKRILMNLLSNSLTYAYPKTDLTITVNQKSDYIEVCVKNHSPYMTPETIKTIFNKYATHAEKFNKVGAGLGLYLSKQITEAHGGRIIAESFENNQCIFGFEIPIEKHDAQNLSPEEISI